jgi:hypothetical protein
MGPVGLIPPGSRPPRSIASSLDAGIPCWAWNPVAVPEAEENRYDSLAGARSRCCFHFPVFVACCRTRIPRRGHRTGYLVASPGPAARRNGSHQGHSSGCHGCCRHPQPFPPPMEGRIRRSPHLGRPTAATSDRERADSTSAYPMPRSLQPSTGSRTGLRCGGRGSRPGHRSAAGDHAGPAILSVLAPPAANSLRQVFRDAVADCGAAEFA